MSDSTLVKRACYRLAVRVGLDYVRSSTRSRGERFLRTLLYWPFYWLVLYHLKRQIGLERVRWAVCAAAGKPYSGPLPR